MILKLSAFYVLSVFFGKMAGNNFNDLHLLKSNEWIFYSTFVPIKYLYFFPVITGLAMTLFGSNLFIVAAKTVLNGVFCSEE